jgi:hypothetical protein
VANVRLSPPAAFPWRRYPNSSWPVGDHQMNIGVRSTPVDGGVTVFPPMKLAEIDIA